MLLFTSCFVYLSGKSQGSFGPKRTYFPNLETRQCKSFQKRYQQTNFQKRFKALNPCFKATEGHGRVSVRTGFSADGLNRTSLGVLSFAPGVFLTFLIISKISGTANESMSPFQLSKANRVGVVWSCQDKPVGKQHCFLNKLQGTESQITVTESGISQLWNAYQRRKRWIADTCGCKTCFHRIFSRFNSSGLCVTKINGPNWVKKRCC